MKRVWRVREIGMHGAVLSGQTRNIPAHSRKEAKEKYISKGYKKFSSTQLTAIVIGDMSEWVGNPNE